MPSTAAIRAGAAFVELSLKDGRFQRGLKRAEMRLRAFGDGVTRVGRTLTIAATLSLAPIALATRTYAQFSDTMALVGAVTRSTEKQLESLTNTAKRLGRTTSFTASQVAAGMVELGRAGFSPEQIEAAIGPVLNLSRATGTELARAAEIAAATLRGFGLEATETGRIADVLTATANASAQTLDDIGEAMKMVAPLAMEAGESLESTAAALGVLANNGIKGTLAGNALARAYKNLSSTKAQEQLRALGVEAVDANGNLRPLAAILTELGQKTQGLGSAQRLSIFEELFGRGQAAALKLAAPTATFKDLQEVLQSSAGTAQRTAKAMDDTLGGSFRLLMSAAEGVQIAIGEALDKTLRGLMQRLTRVAGIVSSFIDNNRQLIVTIVKVIAGVGAAGVALIALGATVKLLAFAFGGLTTILAAAGTVIGAVGTLLSALLSPIGLVVAAVAALGVAVLKETGAAGAAVNWLSDRFNELKTTVSTAWGAIGSALAAGDISLAVKVLWLTIKMEFEKGVAALTDLWTSFRFAFQKIFTDAAFGILSTWTEVTTALANAWHAFLSESSKALETARNFFTKQFIKLMALFDEEIDVEAAIRMADEDLEKFKATSDREAQRRIAQNESDRDEKLDALDKARQDALSELEADASDRFRKTAEAVDEARRKWREAIEEAKNATPASPETPDLPGTPQDDPIREASDALTSAAATLQATAKKQATLGTFNAAAILGLQVNDDHTQRTAKATEQTARNTRRLLEEARDGGLAFT